MLPADQGRADHAEALHERRSEDVVGHGRHQHIWRYFLDRLGERRACQCCPRRVEITDRRRFGERRIEGAAATIDDQAHIIAACANLADHPKRRFFRTADGEIGAIERDAHGHVCGRGASGWVVSGRGPISVGRRKRRGARAGASGAATISFSGSTQSSANTKLNAGDFTFNTLLVLADSRNAKAASKPMCRAMPMRSTEYMIAPNRTIMTTRPNWKIIITIGLSIAPLFK